MRLFKNLERVHVLDERFYTIDHETFYPSVTTVLDSYPKGKFLAEWLKDNGRESDEILRKAGEQGSNVHNAIEGFLKGGELIWIEVDGRENFTLKEWQMISRFMDFYKNVQKVSKIEMLLFSNTHKIGGTLDLVCEINGERWLLDYKTSNAIYKTYELQLAIYKEMFEEMFPLEKIDRYGVLWLNANVRTEKQPLQGVGWQIKEFTENHTHNLTLFKHTQALWLEENKNYKPKNLEYQNIFKL